jgi:hypothetical protein
VSVDEHGIPSWHVECIYTLAGMTHTLYDI